MIPVTPLIILGLLFFKPLPLYVLTMLGITVSSISVYYLSGFMNLDTILDNKYKKQVTKTKLALKKSELPIIISWSAFPFLPTDIICYACGALRIDIKKLVLGVLIGEGITSGLYIFLGHYLLQYAHITL